MKKYLLIPTLSVLVYFFAVATLTSQSVVQLTDGESTSADSNFESLYTIDGQGYYTSYIDDKVHLYQIDTDSLIYSTSFMLCEEEILEWIVYGQEVIYVSYYDIIIENISDGSTEKINYNENLDFDFGGNSVDASVYLGMLTVTKYPGAERRMYDIQNRRFLTDYPLNLKFVTNEYLYHSEGFWGDSQFMRVHRDTQERDTLLSNYTPEGNIAVNGKYFLLSEEKPILSVDANDVVRTYDFDHDRIASGLETSTGKLICSEYFQGGTILYTLDIDTGELLAKDSLFLERSISLLDSYEDKIYVTYNTQFQDAYGYLEPPYAEVTLITPDYDFFSTTYKSKSQNLLIFEHYKNGHIRNFLIHEKSTGESTEFSIQSFNNFLEDITATVDTDEGIRIVVNKSQGKMVHSFDAEANSLSESNQITNKRGLGTDVIQNKEGFILSSNHSLQSTFEYIHPVSKELLNHEVDGIIHGSAVAYEGKYFYIRNQTYQGVDETFFLDFMRFDPMSGELKMIKEDFLYPADNVSFSNINFGPDPGFGFISIYNTGTTFDLRNEVEFTADSQTKDLLSNIFIETPQYYYASETWPSKSSYRISKDNYQDRTLILSNSIENTFAVDEKSFVAVLSNGVKHVTEDDVIDIPVPSGYNYQRTGFLDNQVLMIWADEQVVMLDIYDLATAETQSIQVEGWPAYLVGDFLISITGFDVIQEYASMHMEDGTTYFLSPDRPLTYLYNTDSTLYFLDREAHTIIVYGTDWTVLETIETEAFKNAAYEQISEAGHLPLIFEITRPRAVGQYWNTPDRSLVLFDPRNDQIDEWFMCDDAYRYRQMFELSDNALVLLRTEDMGYQVCEVEIPNFQGTSNAARELDIVTDIRVSPNPATESISISIDYRKLEVFTAMGTLVHRSVDNAAINIRSLTSGTYFLHITDEQDRSFMKKLIKL